MNDREQIRAYLEDPETLYKEWYSEQTEFEIGIGFGEPTKAFEDCKKAFANWVETHRSKLREVICPKINTIKTAMTQIDMVLVIIDLIEEQPYVGAVKKAATLLLLYGIDKLCIDYES